jgi:hypothetical protein
MSKLREPEDTRHSEAEALDTLVLEQVRVIE